jgi:hypothetical protein
MTVTTTAPGAMALYQEQGGRAAWSSGPPPVNSNCDWGAELGREMKATIERQASRAPRSNQLHLGPSELGSRCDFQVVAKMVGPSFPEARRTNHVASPWPAIVGTAVHAWLAQAMEDENARIGVQRFLTEMRVAPMPEHPGTTDLFDTISLICSDWKCLGPTSMAKIQSPDGPPRMYLVQILLYWLGCRLAGYDARRVAIIALPRTAPTLDGMYVWGCEPGPAEIALLQEVIRVTAVRRQIATEILKGNMRLADVPITPDPDLCFVCPFFRPQSAKDGGPGCPGTSAIAA